MSHCLVQSELMLLDWFDKLGKIGGLMFKFVGDFMLKINVENWDTWHFERLVVGRVSIDALEREYILAFAWRKLMRCNDLSKVVNTNAPA